MKCPECGQWNRASMPHCTRCGAKLNIDAASRLEWKESLRDEGQSTAYIRVDEFGTEDRTPDSRDVLAKEMQELKVRKREGEARKAKMLEQRPSPGACRIEEIPEDPELRGRRSGCAGFPRRAWRRSRRRKSAIGSATWMTRAPLSSPAAMIPFMRIPWRIIIIPMASSLGSELPSRAPAEEGCCGSC